METRIDGVFSEALRISFRQDGKEIARARLILFHNDLHAELVGYLEDVFVDEACRGRGLGLKINKAVIRLARKRGCYKIVATSRSERTKVHEMYRKLGYHAHGIAFRLDLPPPRKKGKRKRGR